MVQFHKIRGFESEGFDIFRYVPFTSELSYSLSRTYYYNLYPNEISLGTEMFADALTNLNIMGNYQYVDMEDSGSQSVFYAYRKNYLFGNPCTYSPNVLTMNQGTMQNCLTLNNGSLTAGLSTYLRNVQSTF